MKTIDEHVLAGYNAGIERNRLRTDIGLIEFERTKELLGEYLPPAPAVVYDIGGAYGEYAWWLASRGYEAHLFDIAKGNIAMSGDLAAEYPGYALASAEICDARSVSRGDESADAVLLMGPLYHILDKRERILAIRESLRLLRRGGVMFAAGITPYATLLWATTVYGRKNRLLEDKGFMEMVERELRDGSHLKREGGAYNGLGNAHFHSAVELRSELAEGGFEVCRVHNVVGGAWLAWDIDALWSEERSREALMRTVRLLDDREDISGLSTHILAVAVKP